MYISQRQENSRIELMQDMCFLLALLHMIQGRTGGHSAQIGGIGHTDIIQLRQFRMCSLNPQRRFRDALAL
jgi:hypothetical protein